MSTTMPKPRFFRRPIVLIAAGAIVLVLIVGGIILAVNLHGTAARPHIAAVSTNALPKPTTEPGAKPTTELTPTPTPSASVAQPAPEAGAAANPPAAAPAPPAAPVAPAPPAGAGPGRTSGPTISSFTVASQICPNGADGKIVLVKISWSFAGGNGIHVKDTYGELVGAGPNGFASTNNPGSVDFQIPCNGHDDPVTLTVNKTTYPPTSASKSGDIVPAYPNG